MKNSQHPVLTTVLFGLICGISLIPLNLVLNNMFFWPNAICLTLWLFTAGYAVLLCRWSKQKLMSVSYPILFLLLTVFLVQSIGAFFFLALAAISWIRSGLCYQERGKVRLVVELFLCVAGGALVTVFTPGSALSWALAIWLFFLLQALYFAIFDSNTPTLDSQYEQEVDPFERASRRAEDILSAPPLA
ncbi:hypothetical protein D1BOALGB6SA_2843 [Olavius sp. associated proteobacterium Delta 1]|nr:hypothetical protein D1BOALGB6SA_2843 [Olavius sp. associated proteobacterium Delta 1]